VKHLNKPEKLMEVGISNNDKNVQSLQNNENNDLEDRELQDTSDEDFGEKYELHKSLQYWFGNDIEYERFFRIQRWSKIEEVLIRTRMYQNSKKKNLNHNKL